MLVCIRSQVARPCHVQGMSVAIRDLGDPHESGPSHSPCGAKWEDLGCSTRFRSQAAWESCQERAALKVGGIMAQKKAGSTSGTVGVLWENFYGEI